MTAAADATPAPAGRRRRPPPTRWPLPDLGAVLRVRHRQPARAAACGCAPTTTPSAARGRRAPGFRAADGTLAPVALTTLLDEAAFWLGALATGESGMTTELRVTLHGRAPRRRRRSPSPGARASARPRAGDARYWDTAVAARDAGGRLVASAAITFVAVRGAARRLVTGMLAVNAPDVLRRVFPGLHVRVTRRRTSR